MSKCLLISQLQSPSAVILELKKICHCFHFLPICHEVMGLDAMVLVFWILSFKPAFSLPSFTVKRLFNSSSLSAFRVVSSGYLRLLPFLLTVLIPASDSSNLAFHVMYSTYKLNKQGSNKQPWQTPFPVLNQSIVARLVLIVASCRTYRILKRQVVFPSF